jgi:Flp pilus assembly protein TadD/TolB-like protein
MTRRSGRRAAAFLLASIACTGTGASAQTPDRVLVMPFENSSRDSRIIWMGEAAAVLLTDDFTAHGVNAISRTERLDAFERLQVPPAAVLTDATVIRIGQIVGANQVVIGSFRLTADTVDVRARNIALDTGRVQKDVTEHGPLTDLYTVLERVSHRVGLGPNAAGGSAEPAHPPIAAFESYIKGVLAETPATATNYLNAALKLSPGFDRARLALWDVYTDQGEHDKALQALAPVSQDSRYSRRARFRSGLSQLDLRRYDDAFAAFKALADSAADAAALNNLGVVQLRRGAGQTGQAAYYFHKAAETDAAEPDYVFNLGYAYWLNRDTQATIYWLREAVRRRPADGVAHYVLGTALGASGSASAAEAAREKELAHRLSSEFVQWDRRPAGDPIPRNLERIKPNDELRPARELEARLTTSEQRDQQDLAQFYMDRGRRLFDRQSDREAAAELNRALYLSPYLADAHLLLGRIHLRNGRVREAIDAFKISLWSSESAEAHAALGEAFRQDHDPANARAEADSALALDPDSAEARALVARLDGR